MADDYPLTLRQIDGARGDLYAVADEIETVKMMLARVPTRRDLAQAALGIIVASAALVVGWFELFGLPRL